MAQKKPTKAWIFAELERRRTIYSVWHGQVDVCQNFLDATSIQGDQRMLAYFTGFVEGYSIRVGPVAKDAVEVGVQQLIVGEHPSPTYHLPDGLYRGEEADVRTKYRKHREEVEAGCTAFLRHIETSHMETPFRSAAFHQLGLGLGVIAYPPSAEIKHPFDMGEGKTREPRDDKERVLLRKYQRDMHRRDIKDVRVVHPSTVFPDPYHDPIQDMIEEQEASYSQYRDKVRDLAKKDGRDSSLDSVVADDTTKIVLYCSDDWYGCWYGTTNLLTSKDGADEDGIAPNKTERLWYKIAPGGFGARNGKGQFEHWWKGILHDGRELIIQYLTLMNVLEALRMNHAFMEMEFIGPATEDGQQIAIDESEGYEAGPGKKFAHSGRVTVKAIDKPPPPPIIFDLMTEVKTQMEVHFGPEILRGILQGSPETVAGQRNRVAHAKGPYKAPKQSLETAIAGFLDDVLYQIKHGLMEPYTGAVRGGGMATLKPDKIHTEGSISVDTSPPTEEEKAFIRQDQMARLQSGTLSKWAIMRDDPDIDDAEEEWAIILAEMAMTTPEFISTIAQTGIQDAASVMQPQQQMEMQAPPMPGPGGMTLPGEAPAPPAAGSPQDMMNASQQPQQNSLGMPQVQQNGY